MTENSPLLYNTLLKSLDKKHSATIKIFTPQKNEYYHEIAKRKIVNWILIVDMELNGNRFKQEIKSQTSLGAISLATDYVRIEISKISDGWEDENELPHWVLFPHTVPIGWGEEFYDEIVAFIKEKNKNKNKEIERRKKANEKGKNDDV